jgi:hypothetical protein
VSGRVKRKRSRSKVGDSGGETGDETAQPWPVRQLGYLM